MTRGHRLDYCLALKTATSPSPFDLIDLLMLPQVIDLLNQAQLATTDTKMSYLKQVVIQTVEYFLYYYLLLTGPCSMYKTQQFHCKFATLGGVLGCVLNRVAQVTLFSLKFGQSLLFGSIVCAMIFLGS